MRRAPVLFGLSLLIASQLFVAFKAHAEFAKDQLGRSVAVPARAKRIVALAPSLAELAANFVGTDLGRIVGVSEYSDEPPALKKIESVGPYHQLNLEKILALKPDLVLATSDGNARDQIEHLAETGLPVFVVSTRSIAEVSEAMRLVGKALGSAEAGIQMAAQLDLGISRIRARAKTRSTAPRVLLQVGDDPLVIAGGKSFLAQALEVIGAKNVYSDSDLPYPRPSIEDIIHRNPDVILILTMGAQTDPYLGSAKRWGNYSRLKAAREKHIRIVKGDSVVRPTLRLLEGLALLEMAIFGEVRATQTPEPESKPDGSPPSLGKPRR